MGGLMLEATRDPDKLVGMLRWRWVLLWWVIGGVLLWLGVMVELGVREHTGTGFKRRLAHLFYPNMISEYRLRSRACAVAGPLIIIVTFLIRARWDRIKKALFLDRKADKLDRKASVLVEKVTGSTKTPIEDLPPRLKRKVSGMLEKSSRIRVKADRLRERAED